MAGLLYLLNFGLCLNICKNEKELRCLCELFFYCLQFRTPNSEFRIPNYNLFYTLQRLHRIHFIEHFVRYELNKNRED